ncbi:HugZ family protein [Alteromonas sp. A079]|uniref:HugZ family pyridoxamine 5'-phosphate oxidase n=1 Tax=Alteromonas sp. A079 TaxID=3410268 RepID=UPI003B9F97D3
MRTQALTEAKALLRACETGVISTISHNLRGYPFGSVSPFISCSEGKLYFYISDIAQHAKNLEKDSRMSLTVFHQAEEGDQNAHGRVTVVGDAAPIKGDKASQILEQYVRRFPEAETYKQAHDFNVWQMDVVRVRYIGGFGKIFWLEPEEWQAPASPWGIEAEKNMIDHMNEDHQDAMSLILGHHHAIQDDTPTMTGIVNDGFYIHSNNKNYYVPFENRCTEQGSARTELVRLTNRARKAQAA